MDVRIGVTTSFDEGEQRLHHRYVQAVEQAGGLPLIVPMLDSDAATQAFAGLLDGLVITGGPAVTEGLEGELAEDLDDMDPVRLRADRRILASFLETPKPMLGICYGMQLINAAAGGTIYGDVERQRERSAVHSQKRGGTSHSLRLQEGTHLARLLNKPDVTVNTRHLQAIAIPGSGFQVAATAPDGVIEAIENEAGTILGVQFHPERLGSTMQPLFQHLVEEARQQKQPASLLSSMKK